MEQALEDVDWKTTKNILEEGGGTGAFSDVLVGRMQDDARLTIVESDPELARMLDTRFREHKNVSVLACKAEEAHNALRGESFDRVITGIPLSVMHDIERHLHIKRLHSLLRPGGSLIVYQMSNAVHEQLQEVFHGHVSVEKIKSFDPRNPRLIFTAHKSKPEDSPT